MIFQETIVSKNLGFDYINFSNLNKNLIKIKKKKFRGGVVKK